MSLEGQDKYEIDREVGRGAFAAVYLGKRKSDGQRVAIKQVLRKSRRSGVDWTALREVKILQELNSKNVVGLLDVFALRASINMVMEFCPFDLAKVINAKGEVLLTESHIKAYMQMTLQGMAELHKFWILHRDMKPDNMLFGDDRQLKVADFGLASVYGEPDTEDSYKVVTLPYRSPELIFGAKEYGPAIDIWSCGCIMAELMLRQIFLPGMSDEDQLAKIFYIFGTPTEEEWPNMKALHKYIQFTPKKPINLKNKFGAHVYSSQAIDLLTQLMRLNPRDRPSAEEALKHPFFLDKTIPATPPEDLPYDVFVNKSKKKDEEGAEKK